MSCFKILAKLARLSIVRNIIKYRLAEFEVDFVLDFSGSLIIVLSNQPGVLIFNIETTNNIRTHFEVHLRSEGKTTPLGTYPFNLTFPKNKKPELQLIEN